MCLKKKNKNVINWINLQKIAEAGSIKQAAFVYPIFGVFLDIPFLGDNRTFWNLYWGGMLCSISILAYSFFAPREFRHFASLEQMALSTESWIVHAANEHIQNLKEYENKNLSVESKITIYVTYISETKFVLQCLISLGFVIGGSMVLGEVVINLYDKVLQTIEFIGK